MRSLIKSFFFHSLVPCVAQIGADGLFDLFDYRRALFVAHLVKSRLYHSGVLFRAYRAILFAVFEYPCFALGHDLASELFFGKLVAPVAERPFGKLHDVAFVNQRHRRAVEIERVLYRRAAPAASCPWARWALCLSRCRCGRL